MYINFNPKANVFTLGNFLPLTLSSLFSKYVCCYNKLIFSDNEFMKHILGSAFSLSPAVTNLRHMVMCFVFNFSLSSK